MQPKICMKRDFLLGSVNANEVFTPVDCSGRREDSSENANAFSSCVGSFEEANQFPAGSASHRETPQALKAPRRLPDCKEEFDL
jgi:hypothetical protein